ncbi:MAG: cytochrome c [Pseudomonadota bacterium]
MRLLIAALVGTGLTCLAAGNCLAEGNVDAGREKAQTCTGCHAVEGYFNVYPSYRVPKLGGQNAAYVESALKQYRDGGRKHPTMHANAWNLSDADIADIAAYFSSVSQ